MSSAAFTKAWIDRFFGSDFAPREVEFESPRVNTLQFVAALGGLFDSGKVLSWATRALFVVLGLALVGVGVTKAAR